MKILVIRFSSIGDIVLTTPVIRCVKQQVKNAELHFLTKERFAGVVKHNPYIDKLLLLDDKKSLATLAGELKKEKYDYVLDLHNNLRTLLLKSMLSFGVPFRSFDKQNFKKWLMVRFRTSRPAASHIVDRYLDTASDLGIKNDGKGLDFFISPEEDNVAGYIPPSQLNQYTAVSIGGHHATKKLPVEKLVELCSSLQGLVVLLGGKEDAEAGRHIKNLSSGNIMNLCGQLSLGSSASVLKHAKTVITHDTGLMHIAAAFGKKIISIWGNTIPEFGMYPYQPAPGSVVFEVKGLSCRPCSKIGFEKCPRGHFNCMIKQDIPAISRAAE